MAKPFDLEREYQKKLREQSIILKVSQSIIETLDYEKVLQIISDGMAELLGIESSAIYLLQNQKDLYLGATTPALDPEMPDFLRRAILDQHPYIKAAVTTRKPQYLPDSRDAELTPQEMEILKIRNLRSLLYFPFVQEKQVLGVLILGTIHKKRDFTQYEIDLGQTVANQLSIGIQNAILHEELFEHKEHLEQLVKEKTKDLDQAITELKDLNEELKTKSEDIFKKNEKLEATLQHLKEAQTQLIQAEKMASLGVLTAGVAHEINNPLNFLVGACEGIEAYFEKHKAADERQVQVFLKSMNSGIERVSGIVKSLNQFSRDNDEYNEDCDIHSILENCILMLTHQLGDDIEISRDYWRQDLVIRGNVGKLHQAFVNILTNAIQAIEGKGEIYIRTRKEKRSLHIVFEDTGSGIHDKDLNRITDPFFTTKDPGEGTGLGLSISYSIIRKLEGEMKFRSTPGKGTTVTIILPAI